MSSSCTKEITLHPQAKELLFTHFRTLIKIFNDVLGHLEVDYMAIALLTARNELMFLSSTRAIESNLIEQNLWPLDASFQEDFFLQNEPRLWDELYHGQCHAALRRYKQENPGFSTGISIPSQFEAYRVVYTFALKSTDEVIKHKAMTNINTLTRMGRFCLQRIMQTIPLPDQQQPLAVKKPILKLIVNNKR